MNHRVKNLLALASGLVALSARTAKTPQELAEAIQKRLGALARAHDLMLIEFTEGKESSERPTTLPALVGAIVSPYLPQGHDEDARIFISGPDTPIGGNAITSIALLLHEFATNAAKHGALSTSTGQVNIEWSVERDELLLTWREHGGPSLSGEPKREGFGGGLARAIVTGQLAGQISRDWNPEGLVVRLSVPLERLTKSDETTHGR
ncbi:HWE histidine kinase domain-containing protein [Methylocapsa polymorpha]|uniref:histidine kinase n=1 Tax=Methylocapsa polymorpha TaxID=3080828 RepID=A0ABZ0HRE1_9HYPH|nr:HWE histidine kinase domain-containing protein [Methylocapsa sp. RX1]